MKLNILVTGGTGFIGSHLCEKLVKRNHNLTIITSSGNYDNIKSIINKENVIIVNANISEYASLEKSIANNKFDIIFHLASYIPKGAPDDDLKCIKVNDIGTKNILEFAKNNQCKKFIYSSTGWVYGNPQHIPVDENHPKNPFDAYGKTKLNGENYCKKYSKYMNIIILRYAGVYGPRKDKGAVYSFIKNMLEKKTIIIYGDGTQTNDYIYVNDVINANLLAMEIIEETTFDIFNVGSGQEKSAIELANLIGDLLKIKPKIKYKDTKITNKRYFLDITKAKKILKFKPSNFKICLEKFITYIKESEGLI